MDHPTRRHVLRFGAAALAGGLAGCTVKPDLGVPDPDPLETPDDGPAVTDTRLTWQRSTEGSVRRILVRDGTLYAATNWNVYRLEPDGGEVVWTHQLAEPSDAICHDGGLAVHDRFAYATGCDGMRALSVDDGAREWETDVVTSMKAPAATDETVFASGYEAVAAVAVVDGTERWTADLDSQPTRPVAGGGRVLVGGRDGLVTAFDAESGDVDWTQDTGSERAAVPTAVDEAVYVGTSTPDESAGRLFALDPSDGSEQWSVETGQTLAGSRPVLAGESVYVGTASGELVCHRRADGRERWRFETDDWLVTRPAVAPEVGRAYAGSSDGSLYAVDVTDGTEAWSLAAGYPNASPVLGDGVVYYAGDTLAAYAA